MYQITTTQSFEKTAKKFFKQHPDLKEKFRILVNDLSQNPFQSHLKLHPLKGKLDGLWAVRLTFSFRMILTLEISPDRITLLDVGSHDEVY